MDHSHFPSLQYTVKKSGALGVRCSGWQLKCLQAGLKAWVTVGPKFAFARTLNETVLQLAKGMTLLDKTGSPLRKPVDLLPDCI